MAAAASPKSSLRVAVAQTSHVNWDIRACLRQAQEFIKDASLKGAKLILLPEFFSTGYVFDTQLWFNAEGLEGPTLTAMRRISTERDIVVAFTVLEATADGEFFNTFVLVEPTGTVQTCRKTEPAALEAYLFKGQESPHVFRSLWLGLSVGVGICYENMLADHALLLLKDRVDSDCVPFDLLLMPHSAPTTVPSFSFSKTQVIFFFFAIYLHCVHPFRV